MGEIIAEEESSPQDRRDCNENPPAHEQGDFHQKEKNQQIHDFGFCKRLQK
jgi:hypothetical protein